MPKSPRTRFLCTSCGQSALTWSGRCSGCEAWNSLVETSLDTASRSRGSDHANGSGPVPLSQVDVVGSLPRPTGVPEVDRVLGGGLVPGSVTLLSGPPGVGKSTLGLQTAAGLAGAPASPPALYVAAEETVAQIRRRADRLGLGANSALYVDGEPSLDAIRASVATVQPGALIVDSIQTVFDPSLDAGPGSVTQVRHCAQQLADLARATNMIIVLIGHVTKEGSIAGPRLLEHLVDTVVTFDAEVSGDLRLLRATKHRFGPTGELGVFTMDHNGLTGVADAAGLFLADRCIGVPGSVVVPILAGRRTMLVEVQALIRRADGPHRHHRGHGIEGRRVELALAVLERQTGLFGDVIVSVAGGLSTDDPGVDLGIALAVASAAMAEPLDPNMIVVGELGLAGELRRVRSLDGRLAEAARLGYRRALVPEGTGPDAVDGIELIPVTGLGNAIEMAFGVARPGFVEGPHLVEAS